MHGMLKGKVCFHLHLSSFLTPGLLAVETEKNKGSF